MYNGDHETDITRNDYVLIRNIQNPGPNWHNNMTGRIIKMTEKKHDKNR
eukprot:UN01227